MTTPPPAPPLPPEEIAEARKLVADTRHTLDGGAFPGNKWIASLCNTIDRLLSCAERLAEVERQSHIDRELALVRQRALAEAVARYETAERQLAEADAAHAKLSHVKRSNFDKVGREISYADAARWAAEAVKRHASCHPKEPEPPSAGDGE